MKIFINQISQLTSKFSCGESLIKVYRYHSIRCISTNEQKEVATIGNGGMERAKLISKAMKIYLDRAKNYDSFIENEIAEFEIGKRHLANMMGVNPENFTQQDIDSAIEYLLPSGLFDKKARPKLKHPLDILPKKKVAQFGNDGRPHSPFFYTIKFNFSESLHNISVKLESLKEIEDKNISKKQEPDESLKLEVTGSDWLNIVSVNNLLDENLSESEYKSLINALERLATHPYSYMEKDFIFKFRKILPVQNLAEMKEKFEIKVDENNREYLEAIGARKTCEATVKLFKKGTGIFTINGQSLIRYFPKLIDREQVLYPLHLCDALLTVDVVAEVEGGHSGNGSSQAGAVRHGISRALQGAFGPLQLEKLRLAGLLQKDLRNRERKKPGQKGARAKFTWKKR